MMSSSAVIIRTLAELGDVYLSWCVLCADRTQIVVIDREAHRIPDAQQLRVRDLTDPDVRTALSTYEGRDGRMVLDSIEWMRDELAAGRGIDDIDPADPPRGFRIDDALILREGNHRAAALRLLGHEELAFRIEIDATLHPRSEAYANPVLRATSRS